ncbi:signal peptidase I [Halorientalis salina]|uniref:signal peptidase I n=1 Tax=Halorientalis salina TaxID=2932266 RepID=UPI0010ABCC2F|nr:signal peptidase I [Halorientalis salina]
MIQKAGLALLIVFALALVAPAASPLQISYVTSESMSPTIETNDGYVLVPAGETEPGDIITFYSEQRESYVTHRAVSVTDAGIVTKGDANPSTDQVSGYPPVSQSAVTGKVLRLDGSPLLIPHLGTALTLVQTYWYVALALLAGYLLFGAANDARARNRDSVLRSRDIVLPVTVLAIVAGIAVVSLGAVHQTQVYSVTDEATTDSATLTVGEPRTESLTVSMTSTPLAHVVTDTDGMRIVESSPASATASGDGSTTERTGWLPWQPVTSSRQNVTVEIPPQEQTGPHATSIHMYPYPAVLPADVIAGLHRVHPAVAAVTTVLASIVPLYLVYWLVIDPTTPLRGTRRRLTRTLGGRR